MSKEIELNCVEEVAPNYRDLYYRQENDLRRLHYELLKTLGTSLPVGMPKISAVEAFEQILHIMRYQKAAAESMYHDLIALGQAVPEEACRIFGGKNGSKRETEN